MCANWSYPKLSSREREGAKHPDDAIERIPTNEEKSVDWLEAQLHLVGEVEEEAYLAERIRN